MKSYVVVNQNVNVSTNKSEEIDLRKILSALKDEQEQKQSKYEVSIIFSRSTKNPMCGF